MDLTTLSFADVFAVKEEAKLKEEYYRGVSFVDSDPAIAALQQKFARLIFDADQELLKRIG
jgi:hypothetical protein